ncbi:sigma 54-interacting transcriptional regulator [Pseudorhodoferax aquiterrae]|uniref:sigma 54-interacting transcriptional regulator n=1 Tax=Pseudorhodoferax aquiterrae TaxID=747304 RepID=UPI0035709F82
MDDLALRAEDAQRRAEQYRRAAGSERTRRQVGRSAAHRALLREIALVGPSALTVLVSGETGVGKELVVQALHASSASREAWPPTTCTTTCRRATCSTYFRRQASSRWPRATSRWC